MSSSSKKKSNKQIKTYLAVLAPILAVLILLALILSFGRYSSMSPGNQEPSGSNQDAPGKTTDPAQAVITPTYSMDDAVLGIDVSEHQKSVDWEQVKASGVDFVMIRIGYRGYTEGRLYMDSYFAQHYRGAKDAGLDVGVYFFSQAVTPAEARMEARLLLALLNWRKLEMGIAFDWEFVSGDARTGDMDGRTMTDCALAFCETIADAGHTPLVYFNQYQAENYYALDELSHYDFWLAQYAEELDFPYQVKMWQYTEEGTVPGIPGAVDMNL